MWRYGFAILLLLPASSAWSFGPCEQDSERLCGRGECPGETQETCLYTQADGIKDVDCKSFIKKTAGTWQKKAASFTKLKSSCQSDIKKFCDEIACRDKAIKAVQVCLMSHGESLTAACKKDINRHIREFQSGVRELD